MEILSDEEVDEFIRQGEEVFGAAKEKAKTTPALACACETINSHFNALKRILNQYKKSTELVEKEYFARTILINIEEFEKAMKPYEGLL